MSPFLDNLSATQPCASTDSIGSAPGSSTIPRPGDISPTRTAGHPPPEVPQAPTNCFQAAGGSGVPGGRGPGGRRGRPPRGAHGVGTPCRWCGISPLIWRRLLVPGETTLAGLHAVVQTVFGWGGEHLHRFVIHGTEYGISYVGGQGLPPRRP